MASRRQRDREEIRAVETREQADSLFGGLLDDVPDDPHLENRLAIGKTPKNMFIFLAMLKARKFPLNVGDRLYVNVGLTGTQKERDYAVIAPDGQIETVLGLRDSLTAAEIDYHPADRRTPNADPWQRFKLKGPDGGYTALNDLLTEHYMDLNVDVSVLTDREALAALLTQRRQVPAPYKKAAANAVKKREAAAKKAAKLEQERAE